MTRDIATARVDDLLSAPRVTVEAELEPLIGTRIQPTGFPNLGAAEFEVPSGQKYLLLESAQSVANRLEATAWDDATNDLVAPLKGLPYVRTSVNGTSTDSLREAHRLNSPYLYGIWPRLRERAAIPMLTSKKGKSAKPADGDASEGEADEASASVDRRKLAAAVFYYDPNSVLHGVFLEKITGLARLTRIVSGFIEATDINLVASGGVKNDRIDPSGKAYEIEVDGSKKSGAKAGFGNVPYARSEYTAGRIAASFSLDIALLQSYGLGIEAERLLMLLGLWKIGTFLERGARLRTACDLVVKRDGLRITRPRAAAFPKPAELQDEITTAITACAKAGKFASPAITDVPFEK